jgi:hypothetical protein
MLHARKHTTASIHPHTRNNPRARAHTHKYVIFIAFPLQLWFRERASVLRYTYIACLVTEAYFTNEVADRIVQPGGPRVDIRSLDDPFPRYSAKSNTVSDTAGEILFAVFMRCLRRIHEKHA